MSIVHIEVWHLRKELFILAGMLVIASALMVAPVAAATYSQTAAVVGNPPETVSIALNLSQVSLIPFTPGGATTNDSLAIIVSSNIVPFTITVQDAALNGKSHFGYMANFTNTPLYSPSPTDYYLSNYLQLVGTTNASTSQQSLTYPMSNLAQPLYVGTAGVYYQWLVPNTFTQQVEYADRVLESPYYYRIDLQFAIQTP